MRYNFLQNVHLALDFNVSVLLKKLNSNFETIWVTNATDWTSLHSAFMKVSTENKKNVDMFFF